MPEKGVQARRSNQRVLVENDHSLWNTADHDIRYLTSHSSTRHHTTGKNCLILALLMFVGTLVSSDLTTIVAFAKINYNKAIDNIITMKPHKPGADAASEFDYNVITDTVHRQALPRLTSQR